MRLYYAPGACSLAPHILLRESRLAFELARVDTASHKLEDGEDYYQINSKGAVPVLELDDGARLSEGPVVSQYICDLASRLDLMPAAASMARYRVMEWQNYVTSELHKSYTPLFNPALDSAGKVVIRTTLRKKYEWLASHLEGKTYLTGDTFTAADAYLYAVTRWAGHVSLELSDLPVIRAFMRRVEQRDAVRQALQAEGLLLGRAA